MGSDSKIEWTDHTFNPWLGCTKVSEGCRHCYAERMARRTRFAKNAFGPGGVRYVVSDQQWQAPIKWNAAAKAAGQPALVFCGSMCDVFEQRDVTLVVQRTRLWKLIESTKHLRWMLLTKRPENVMDMVPINWRLGTWPAHVAVGTTIENQQTCDTRLLRLLSIPAAMRFVSCEPLLGRVWLPEDQTKQLDWVIAGGESGGGARPTHPGWFRSLRNQCQATNTPFLFKQWGEYALGTVEGKRWIIVLNDGSVYRQGKVPSVYPVGSWNAEPCYKFDRPVEPLHALDWRRFDGVCMTRLGKMAAGRELHGVEHLQFPAWAERAGAESADLLPEKGECDAKLSTTLGCRSPGSNH